MEEDYYTVMQDRIRYFSQKYDPLNRYPLVWEEKRNEQGRQVKRKEKPVETFSKNMKGKILLKTMASFIVFLTVCFYRKISH